MAAIVVKLVPLIVVDSPDGRRFQKGRFLIHSSATGADESAAIRSLMASLLPRDAFRWKPVIYKRDKLLALFLLIFTIYGLGFWQTALSK
jgi:hypothetical protein